ncbi:alpha/beta fold hydrolase [Mycolicibacterium komossense]|uniref:Alpha/beta hydrolase n=1 Tax=Mycolicibacterium komossense TaxID=1779 RepID=A0ABT3CC59_9MYCO|nr:alpha/beta hydrolase [Mycolicibacterium komossense]MCV7227079.1 alpha/beta hydrolase [Mycolicibacterium komossense]
MTDDLQVYRYGPPGPLAVLAVHGLTGHGQRWAPLANRYLPDVTVAAPDLIGHGRSPWSAPWTIEVNATALAKVIESDQPAGPVVVVAHSFGGAVALQLAVMRPDLVKALVLLDPAVGLDGGWMRTIADAMLASPDYPDRAEARAEKISGSWGEVDAWLLDNDLDEHLIALPNGRFGWRISLPAVMSYWSELARPIPIPPKGIPTTVVRATRTSPPYVSAELTTALRDRLGTDFALRDFDCDHMVAQAKPEETAALIRESLQD